MARMIGPDIAARFFQRKVNPSSEHPPKIDAEIRERISEIYAGDFRMIERIA
jgi:hypothetical protein